MPFDLEMPDGTIIEDVPDGTTKAQIMARLNGPAAPLTQAQLDQEAYDEAPWYDKLHQGVNQSLTEVGHGVDALLNAGGGMGNVQMAESGRIPPRPEGFGRLTSEADREALARSQAVEGGWKTTGEVGADIATAALPGAAAIRTARGLPAAVQTIRGLAGESVGAGVVEGLQAQDPLTGLAAAGTTAAAGKMLPWMAQVGKSEAARILKEAGVELTPGQYWGGVVKQVEELMSILPGAAGGVRAAKERAMISWNKMLRGNAPPHEAMAEVKTSLGGVYDEVFGGSMKLADDLPGRWKYIQNRVADSLPEIEAGQVNKFLDTLIASVGKGPTKGSKVQTIDRSLAKLATAAARRGDGTQAEAYGAAREALRQSMPELKARLLSVNNKLYGMFKVLEDATAKVAPAKRQPAGNITPGELMASAVKGRRGPASVGEAPMQAHAAQGADVMGSAWPGQSGLAGFAADISPAVPIAMGLVNPAAAVGGLAARGLALNAPMQRALTSETAGQLSRAIPSLAAGTQIAPHLSQATSVADRLSGRFMSEHDRKMEELRQQAAAIRNQ